MSDDERRAYSRGYNNAAKWPAHIPPAPPEPIVAAVISAGRLMRDWIDQQIATGVYEENDCGHLIDGFDAAMVAIGKWIKQTV